MRGARLCQPSLDAKPFLCLVQVGLPRLSALALSFLSRVTLTCNGAEDVSIALPNRLDRRPATGPREHLLP